MLDKLIAALIAAVAAWTFTVQVEPPPPAPVTTSQATTAAPEIAVETTEAAVPTDAPIVETSQATAGSNWMEAMLPDVDPGALGNWVFGRNGGWGASDGYSVWIDPNVPVDLRYSVMVHEYGHLLQARYYGSIWDSPDVEGEADCIAELLGAVWTDYGCSDRDQARRVLRG